MPRNGAIGVTGRQRRPTRVCVGLQPQREGCAADGAGLVDKPG